MSHRASHHYYHAPRLNELRRLYWVHTAKELAANLVTIFVPIYLYRLGYSLTDIMGYFLWAIVFWGVIQAPVLKWANRFGFNRSMGLSLLFQGLQILLLATLPRYHWSLLLIGSAWGMSIALYWPQFRACFTRSLLHKRVGPAVGLSSALFMLALGIAPAIGGAIASWFGIGVLYILAMLCFVLGALPLFVGPEIIGREDFSLRGVPWRRIRGDLIANFGSELDESAASSAWPLFIFLITPTYVGVGIVSSVAVIASILIALYVGRHQTRRMAGYLNGGTYILSLTDALRLITQSIGQVAGVNFFNGLGQALIVTPYYSRYYENAEQEQLLSYVYAMMMAAVAGDIVLYGSLILLSLVVSMKTVLIVGLVMAIPGSYCTRLIRPPK